LVVIRNLSDAERVLATPRPRLLSCFCFRVCREKKDCQCGCRTNGQFCVACAQACCGSVFSMASSVKAAEFGQAVSDSA